MLQVLRTCCDVCDTTKSAEAIDQVAMSADMKNLDKKVNIVIQRLGVRSGSASKSVAPTPSPRTEVLRRQKSQAAYLKPFRLDMDNEQGFLASQERRSASDAQSRSLCMVENQGFLARRASFGI